jgi:hypothetical protein
MEKLTENQINELKLSFLLSTAVCSIIIIIDILILMYLIHDVEILRVIIYLSVIGILIGHLTFKILKMNLFDYNKNNKKLLIYMVVWFFSSIFVSTIFNYFISLKYHLIFPKDLIVYLALTTMVFVCYIIGSFLINMSSLIIKLKFLEN